MNLRTGFASLVLALGGASCGFEDMAKASSEVSLVVDFYFQSIANGTWSQAYGVGTTPDLRASSTQQSWDQLGSSIRDRLGALTSKSSTGIHVQNMNGVVTASATYSAQFEKGAGTISAVLRKVDGKWLLQRLNVNSPLFNAPAAVPCAKCGKSRPADATFCPSCGEKVDAPPPPAPKKD